MTVDLDPLLLRWEGSEPWKQPRADWTEDDARMFAARFAEQGLETAWDPVAEEFMTLSGRGIDRSLRGMVSIFFPLAILNADLPEAPPTDPSRAPEVVRVRDLHEPEVSAEPALLKATVLRWGWVDPDFDPYHFSGWDLFVESS